MVWLLQKLSSSSTWKFSNDIRNLLIKLFLVRRPKAYEWSSVLKKYALPNSKYIKRCKLVPEEHGFFGPNCPYCKTESRQSLKQNKILKTKT